jgi:hypothetical protein
MSRYPSRIVCLTEETTEWVDELVEAAGGLPIFPELRGARLAKDRIVDPAEVARRAGPASLTDGLEQLQAAIREASHACR